METNEEVSTKVVVEDFSSVDEDSCSVEEINQYFPNRYIEVSSSKVTKGNISCSRLVASKDISKGFASVLSDRSIVIVDIDTFKPSQFFQPHEKDITEIHYSVLSDNLLYTSSLDGKIRLYDIRSNKAELYLHDNKSDIKPLTAFDLSPDERLLCSGTELIGDDSFLLFWDIRGKKLLGGYWESHSDDITCIRFNPDQAQHVASSGCDGLLNVFDVSQSSEDESLMYSLNSEDIINSFSWRREGKKNNILAYTDVQSIQIWDIEGAMPSHTFTRDKITKAMKRKLSYECYSVPINYTSFPKNPVILAGSGLEHEGSNCLRTLTINEKSGSLEPHGIFVCKNGKEISSITQVALLSSESDDFITIREDGVISMWNKKFCPETFKVLQRKGKTKIKSY